MGQLAQEQLVQDDTEWGGAKYPGIHINLSSKTLATKLPSLKTLAQPFALVRSTFAKHSPKASVEDILYSDLFRLSVPSFSLRSKAFHFYPGYFIPLSGLIIPAS